MLPPGQNLPASHTVHTSPSFPVKPGSHLQSVKNACPTDAVELLPGQGVQLVLPGSAWKVSDSHGRHVVGIEVVIPA